VNLDPLAFQLYHLAVTEGLAKRRKSLKKIGDFAHGQDLTALLPVATPPVPISAPERGLRKNHFVPARVLL
jgi:hypothetical protein